MRDGESDGLGFDLLKRSPSIKQRECGVAQPRPQVGAVHVREKASAQLISETGEFSSRKREGALRTALASKNRGALSLFAASRARRGLSANRLLRRGRRGATFDAQHELDDLHPDQQRAREACRDRPIEQR
jgi:hypothetical protein